MGVPDNLGDTSPVCCPAKISIYVTKLHSSEMDRLGVQSATWEGDAYHRGCILQFLVDATQNFVLQVEHEDVDVRCLGNYSGSFSYLLLDPRATFRKCFGGTIY